MFSFCVSLNIKFSRCWKVTIRTLKFYAFMFVIYMYFKFAGCTCPVITLRTWKLYSSVHYILVTYKIICSVSFEIAERAWKLNSSMHAVYVLFKPVIWICCEFTTITTKSWWLTFMKWGWQCHILTVHYLSLSLSFSLAVQIIFKTVLIWLLCCHNLWVCVYLKWFSELFCNHNLDMTKSLDHPYGLTLHVAVKHPI